MNKLLLTFLVSLALTACPKDSPTTDVGGSDAEKIDSIAAKLEEYRTREATGCNELCDLKKSACGLSEQACSIAGRNSDRDDFQARCVASQEDCARFSESCSSCAR